MAESGSSRPLAVVTGASSGIGLEIARRLALEGYDLVVAAEDDEFDAAASNLAEDGVEVEGVRADLSTRSGVEELAAAVAGRPVDVLVANAGIGVHGPFVDTDIDDHLALIGLNVTGAVLLTHLLLRPMVERGEGRILFTASIGASTPGPYLSTYHASKSFVYSFAQALRTELQDTGVTVTALLPGPTDTDFFERADMEDTKLVQTKLDDPADVAQAAVAALLAGDDRVIPGLRNRVQVAAAAVTPDTLLAKAQAKLVEPGSGS